MSLCYKCNKSIKPLSLATTVKGEKYHPTCLLCTICDRPLWGRPFKKNNDGSLACENFCEPQIKPNATNKVIISRPSSAQRQHQFLIDQAKINMNHTNLMNLENNLETNIIENKVCTICNKSLINQRYITYESGEIVCQYCEDQKNILSKSCINEVSFECVVCSKPVKGSKFITEKNGDVICENCDLKEVRCDKCNQLFKKNEAIRRLNFDIKYHEDCFNCITCKKLILKEFFLDETKKNPICLDCNKLSKHTFCSNCGINLSNDSDYFKNQHIELPICYKCNLKLNGIKCAKCFQVIEKNGITFADKDFHSGCFMCQSCGIDLTTMKKTLTDKDGNSLYCEPCFIKKFAPMCNKCNEKIPPYLAGTIFQDKNYHKECFSCARCKKTLANKKFFKSGNILICEKCF